MAHPMLRGLQEVNLPISDLRRAATCFEAFPCFVDIAEIQETEQYVNVRKWLVRS